MNRDEVPLEALRVVDIRLIGIRAVTIVHLSEKATGRDAKKAHVSFHTARCRIPSARDVQ